MTPIFFSDGAALRQWFEHHHAIATEVHVGYYKKNSGKTGITYAESVDEALCFGWIDGIVKSHGPESYSHRFTPRRDGSIWSNVNVAHVARLTAAGRMRPAGIKAFEARKAHKTGIYAYEQAVRKVPLEKFPARLEKIFRAQRAAWAFWQEQPPGYRRRLITWAAEAKQTATQDARLARIIAASAAGQRLR